VAHPADSCCPTSPRLAHVRHRHRPGAPHGQRAQRVDVPAGNLLLQTVRSHDQFNTTIYGLNDRYRGIKGGRRVVFVNADDLRALASPTVRRSIWSVCGPTASARRGVPHRRVRHAVGCAAAYFPRRTSGAAGRDAEGSNTRVEVHGDPPRAATQSQLSETASAGSAPIGVAAGQFRQQLSTPCAALADSSQPRGNHVQAGTRGLVVAGVSALALAGAVAYASVPDSVGRSRLLQQVLGTFARRRPRRRPTRCCESARRRDRDRVEPNRPARAIGRPGHKDLPAQRHRGPPARQGQGPAGPAGEQGPRDLPVASREQDGGRPRPYQTTWDVPARPV